MSQQPRRSGQRLLVKLSISMALAGLSLGCAQGGGSAPDPAASDGVGGFDGGEVPQNEWPFDVEQCGAAEYGKQVAASMLVVLDRSGSMAYRWLDTSVALVQMMGEANPALQVGLLPFPALGCDYDGLVSCLGEPTASGCDATLADGCCTDVATDPVVPLSPAQEARDAAFAWLNGQPVDGFTPTLSALKSAYAYMQSQPSEGQRYVVLFTDGAPTLHGTDFGPEAFDACGEEDDLLSAVAAAAEGPTSVKTFAIGSAESWPAAALLSEIALLGGTARTSPCDPAFAECHYIVGSEDFGDELQQVLDRIAGLVGDCTFDIPEGNEQASAGAINVGVKTASRLVPVYRDAARHDGWDFADADQSRVQLYGAACDLYNASPENEVVVVLGCETLVK